MEGLPYATNHGLMKHAYHTFYDEIWNILFTLQMDETTYIANATEAEILTDQLTQKICNHLLEHDYLQLSVDRVNSQDNQLHKIDYHDLVTKLAEKPTEERGED